MQSLYLYIFSYSHTSNRQTSSALKSSTWSPLVKVIIRLPANKANHPLAAPLTGKSVWRTRTVVEVLFFAGWSLIQQLSLQLNLGFSIPPPFSQGCLVDFSAGTEDSPFPPEPVVFCKYFVLFVFFNIFSFCYRLQQECSYTLFVKLFRTLAVRKCMNDRNRHNRAHESN